RSSVAGPVREPVPRFFSRQEQELAEKAQGFASWLQGPHLGLHLREASRTSCEGSGALHRLQNLPAAPRRRAHSCSLHPYRETHPSREESLQCRRCAARKCLAST